CRRRVQTAIPLSLPSPDAERGLANAVPMCCADAAIRHISRWSGAHTPAAFALPTEVERAPACEGRMGDRKYLWRRAFPHAVRDRNGSRRQAFTPDRAAGFGCR